MAMVEKQPKDVVRLQFDVRRAQLNIIDSLVDVCGLSSKKELFNNSMALMKWAVQETQKGRRIASYDPIRDEVEVVALPALDLVEDTSAESSTRTADRTPRHIEEENRSRAANTARARVGVVSA